MVFTMTNKRPCFVVIEFWWPVIRHEYAISRFSEFVAMWGWLFTLIGNPAFLLPCSPGGAWDCRWG